MKRPGGAGETLVFTYGGAAGRCAVVRSKARRLRITVFPDQQVLVVAPKGVPLDQIRERVCRRLGWISKQIDRFDRFQPIQPPRRFVSGETHLFLGRQYRLRILASNRFYVALEGRNLMACSRTPQHVLHIRRMIDRWYLRQAHRIIRERFDACSARLYQNHTAKPRLRLCRMKNRWGSCTRGGTITLNRDLVKAPGVCIDYEIVHELCHLREHNHGKAFFDLLCRYMPDWERRKARLDSTMASAV